MLSKNSKVGKKEKYLRKAIININRTNHTTKSDESKNKVKTIKKELRKIQKGSKRIQKVINKIEVIIFLSINNTLNAI